MIQPVLPWCCHNGEFAEARQVCLTNRSAIRNIPVPKGVPFEPRLRQSKPGRELFSARESGLGAGDGTGFRFLKIPEQLKQAARHCLAHIFVLVHFRYPFEGFSSPV